MRTHKPLLALIALVALSAVLLYTVPASSYIPELTGTSPDHWPLGSTVQWNLNPSIGGNILGGAQITAVQDSFNTWGAAPNTALSIMRGPNSSATAHNANDGTNLICFVCDSSDFGKGGDTLAITYTATNSNGQIGDADILFNKAVTFLTGTATCPTGATCSDLQTIATHEIGHFLGLDHSGVVAAVMFPFAPSAPDVRQTLSYDDVAGISATYAAAGPAVPTGSISGTVHNVTTGTVVCGTHVFADSATSTVAFSGIRKSPIGTITRSDGTYTITGLPADSYTITAEPFDGPVSSSNIGSGTGFCGSGTSLPTNFTTRQH